MLQTLVHYTLHFLFPGIVAYVFFRSHWLKAWLFMGLTMVIDLDHLLSNPIFDPTRCSINFHPLHTYLATLIYIPLFLFKKTRIFGIGLLLHIITDGIDCVWMKY